MKTPKTLKCVRCGKRRPVERFPASRSKKNGKSSWCQKCHTAATRDWKVRTNYDEQLRDARRIVAEQRRQAKSDAVNAANAKLGPTPAQLRQSRKAA